MTTDTSESSEDARADPRERHDTQTLARAPHATDARPVVRRFVVACVEALAGRRPVEHLRTVSTRAGYAQVLNQLAPAARRGQTRRTRAATASQPRLARLVVDVSVPGVAQASSVVNDGDRAWAMSLRFEAHDGRWLCAGLDVI